MSIAVVFVTASAEVASIVTARRSALIPNDLRGAGFAALGGEEVIVSTYQVRPTSDVAALLGHIATLQARDLSGVILLTDDSLPGLIPQLGHIFSVSRFVVPAWGQQAGNMLSAILARTLRSFRHFKTRFDDRKYQQILRLPLRNFLAAEITELREICHDMANRPNFAREFDTFLGAFRKTRQKPKKASRNPVTYFVDDAAKYFGLGHERHAQADTANPPHSDFCVLANEFRFGRAFDGRDHYNVSRERDGQLDGDYPDCHDALRPGGGRQHLNMFSNDFF